MYPLPSSDVTPLHKAQMLEVLFEIHGFIHVTDDTSQPLPIQEERALIKIKYFKNTIKKDCSLNLSLFQSQNTSAKSDANDSVSECK